MTFDNRNIAVPFVKQKGNKYTLANLEFVPILNLPIGEKVTITAYKLDETKRKVTHYTMMPYVLREKGNKITLKALEPIDNEAFYNLLNDL